MTNQFKKWSETNVEAAQELRPQFPFRSWDQLAYDDKVMFLSYFRSTSYHSNFTHYQTLNSFNKENKLTTPAKQAQEHGGPHIEYSTFKGCCIDVIDHDMSDIFLNKNANIVFELLSMYALDNINRGGGPAFFKFLNDLFDQFRINIIITNLGFIPRQEEQIITKIYEPVLASLALKKWEAVNRDLRDSFAALGVGTKEGFSSSLTFAISSLQAFLQITLDGETGGDSIGTLITRGIKNGLLPNDTFSKDVFTKIESTLMRLRQEKGDAHPKDVYATKEEAIFALNLVMVFMQHCIQSANN